MDFNNNGNQNQNQNGYSYNPPPRIPGSGLANAAILMGVISIVSALMMTIYFPFILGSLSILFGILSKGRAPKLLKQAKSGIICGIIGIAANTVIVVSTLIMLFNDPTILRDTAKMYDQMYEQMYGESSEEKFGDSMENMVDSFIEGLQ